MTSQIFANIYLNELDRFVRHNIKPLAYLRYGDDFIIFIDNHKNILITQQTATKWLSDTLKLEINAKNNVVIRAQQGLFFLGHKIYPCSPLAVDGTMLNKIKRDINVLNAASYRAMYLPKKYAKRLPWYILEKL